MYLSIRLFIYLLGGRGQQYMNTRDATLRSCLMKSRRLYLYSDVYSTMFLSTILLKT